MSDMRGQVQFPVFLLRLDEEPVHFPSRFVGQFRSFLNIIVLCRFEKFERLERDVT